MMLLGFAGIGFEAFRWKSEQACQWDLRLASITGIDC
jgi:hypothetical protein